MLTILFIVLRKFRVPTQFLGALALGRLPLSFTKSVTALRWESKRRGEGGRDIGAGKGGRVGGPKPNLSKVPYIGLPHITPVTTTHIIAYM